MKKLIGVMLSVGILVGCASRSIALKAESSSPCPIVSDGETILDCPYAGYVRDLEPYLATISSAKTKLQEFAPDAVIRIVKESALSKEFKMLWGSSLNFDEGAKAIIITDTLYDAIAELFSDVPARKNRVVHAGIEHTYGYLFSNLNTPYGYKRLRWVRPDIEEGFGLTAGTISPAPTDGSLFSNVSYFAGQIAFRNEPSALKILDNEKALVAQNLVAYDYKKLKVTRLEEIVEIAPGRTVTLRTDFVPFTDKVGANGEVLIYSVLDSALPLPYLISMFPVAATFRNGALNPTTLGQNQAIQTRYNAFVPGMTDSPTKWKGTRKVTNP